MSVAVIVAFAAALVPAGLRWLRVAQREHYSSGRVWRFALRWWSFGPNPALLIIGVAGLVLSTRWPVAALASCLVGAVGPVGLPVRGVSSPLRWTNRLRRLGIFVASLVLLAAAVGALLDVVAPLAAGVLLLLPLVLDGALGVLAPMERRLSRVWVEQAKNRLSEVEPLVVAITGSYGKTTTKAFTAQLLSGRYQVVASPASFNNELGLSRAINEHLALGTDVFVAEMGTYGPGELEQLVSWLRPRVSVITGIGPVHLERFGSLERIVTAKAEILEGAETIVLNIDSPELADLAGSYDGVLTCSSQDSDADVYVGATNGQILVAGDEMGRLAEAPLFPGNLACAVGVARALAAVPDLAAIAEVAAPPHRRQLAVGRSGFAIIDDTYNSNPAGALAALSLLEGRKGRRVVVTPGMVELGSRQNAANREFAEAAALVATDVVVVGKTNRRSLAEGARERGAKVKLVRSRTEAVEWARNNLGPGDIVLYENDLPDHYP
ncbi:MAG: Mur ligase family protein [Acidimicrobiia bacterium]